MFTGIIETVGRVVEVSKAAGSSLAAGRSFLIAAPFADALSRGAVGASICVNGVCKTVIEVVPRLEGAAPKHTRFQGGFRSFASKQTLSLTNLKHLKVGSPVNLERALRLGGRLDGHLVSGHVDFPALLIKRTKDQAAWLLTFSLRSAAGSVRPEARYLIKKGSVALNGISLTVYDKSEDTFTVMIIPHTWENTNLSLLPVGSYANLECDLFAKYAENFAAVSP